MASMICMRRSSRVPDSRSKVRPCGSLATKRRPKLAIWSGSSILAPKSLSSWISAKTSPVWVKISGGFQSEEWSSWVRTEATTPLLDSTRSPPSSYSSARSEKMFKPPSSTCQVVCWASPMMGGRSDTTRRRFTSLASVNVGRHSCARLGPVGLASSFPELLALVRGGSRVCGLCAVNFTKSAALRVGVGTGSSSFLWSQTAADARNPTKMRHNTMRITASKAPLPRRCFAACSRPKPVPDTPAGITS
mmetsp:Transcript_119345/g.283316  ORF Transcript_119345/g.283316 Transcript_119345/m.283316 type:complete len:248 (-) Transcript_119345:146-889(-)